MRIVEFLPLLPLVLIGIGVILFRIFCEPDADGRYAFRRGIPLSFTPALYYGLALGIRAVDKTYPMFTLFVKVILLQYPINDSTHLVACILMLISWVMLPLITALLVTLIKRVL